MKFYGFKENKKFTDKKKDGFICSIDDENYSDVKVMFKLRNKNWFKEFYFSTNTSSMIVKQYWKKSNASIYFYRKGLIKCVGVMLKETMEALTNKEAKNIRNQVINTKITWLLSYLFNI